MEPKDSYRVHNNLRVDTICYTLYECSLKVYAEDYVNKQLHTNMKFIKYLFYKRQKMISFNHVFEKTPYN